MEKTGYKKGQRTQNEILRVIRAFNEQKGYGPTIREIGKYLGIRSTSHISYHINALIKKGILTKDPVISRGIHLVQEDTLPEPYSDPPRKIKILGRIQAGQPIPIPASDFSHYDPNSTIEIPTTLTNIHGDLFALEVKGDSMRDMLISEGDIVILKRTEKAQNGHIVAAWLKHNSETTLKRYYFENGQVRLQPANPLYSAIIVSPDDIEIQGQVVMLIREYQL